MASGKSVSSERDGTRKGSGDHGREPACGKGNHLTQEDRRKVEEGARQGLRISEIAKSVGKDPTTISKELKKHRAQSYHCRYPTDCLHYPECRGKTLAMPLCSRKCSSYVQFRCPRRDRTPGVCNGCSRISACHFDKFQYHASAAQQAYEDTLVTTRSGLNLTKDEADALCATVAPLILKGQSPYMILQNHPELGISQSTLYNYISAGLLAPYGVTDSSLPVKAKRKKMSKKKKEVLYKKREDKTYLIGRTYEDYQKYMAEEENLYKWVLQIDTVYNSVSSGPFMETMMFVPCRFLLGFYRDTRTNDQMADGIDRLDDVLGPDLFEEAASVILGDRGSEFEKPELFEKRRDGTQRAHMYYCDPMCSWEKGHVENSHELLRRLVPKNTDKLKKAGIDYTDLRALGLTGQDALNEVLSNVNSVPRRLLDGKTPIEEMRYRKPELWEKMQELGIREIPADKVVLSKDVLKRFRTGIDDADVEPVAEGDEESGTIIIASAVRPKLRRKKAATGRSTGKMPAEKGDRE